MFLLWYQKRLSFYSLRMAKSDRKHCIGSMRATREVETNLRSWSLELMDIPY